MAKASKAIGLGPPEAEREGGSALADAIEIMLGKAPSSEQVEAFRMACKLAHDSSEEYEED